MEHLSVGHPTSRGVKQETAGKQDYEVLVKYEPLHACMRDAYNFYKK